ncbi:hypothetical protein F2P81_019445 [Scophthalmus maximus]|uniref:Uncharacterized protein n=1 Tax=Scophthalmus maximus TaxID=52904 RepID=A0A6A4S805_SCOMX|nr:hypothetical protein F2P81_019445 [Scophthalmus maximus]
MKSKVPDKSYKSVVFTKDPCCHCECGPRTIRRKKRLQGLSPAGRADRGNHCSLTLITAETVESEIPSDPVDGRWKYLELRRPFGGPQGREYLFLLKQKCVFLFDLQLDPKVYFGEAGQISFIKFTTPAAISRSPLVILLMQKHVKCHINHCSVARFRGNVLGISLELIYVSGNGLLCCSPFVSLLFLSSLI